MKVRVAITIIFSLSWQANAQSCKLLFTGVDGLKSAGSVMKFDPKLLPVQYRNYRGNPKSTDEPVREYEVRTKGDSSQAEANVLERERLALRKIENEGANLERNLVNERRSRFKDPGSNLVMHLNVIQPGEIHPEFSFDKPKPYHGAIVSDSMVTTSQYLAVIYAAVARGFLKPNPPLAKEVRDKLEYPIVTTMGGAVGWVELLNSLLEVKDPVIGQMFPGLEHNSLSSFSILNQKDWEYVARLVIKTREDFPNRSYEAYEKYMRQRVRFRDSTQKTSDLLPFRNGRNSFFDMLGEVPELAIQKDHDGWSWYALNDGRYNKPFILMGLLPEKATISTLNYQNYGDVKSFPSSESYEIENRGGFRLKFSR